VGNADLRTRCGSDSVMYFIFINIMTTIRTPLCNAHGDCGLGIQVGTRDDEAGQAGRQA
jgi:hypothetical protein